MVSARILTDAVWVTVGQVLSAVGALAAVRIMSELISPTDFGTLTLLLGVAALALNLSVTPTLQALLRYYAEWTMRGDGARLRRVALIYCGHGILAAGVVLIIGSVVFAKFTLLPWYTGLLLTVLLLVDGIRSYGLAVLSAARNQRMAALIYAADAWSRPIAAAAMIGLLGSNANVALIGYIAGSSIVVIGMAMTLTVVGRKPTPTDHVEEGSARQIAGIGESIRRYALPLLPLAVFGWVSGTGDRYIIGGTIGLAAAGIYAAAYGLASRPFFMLSSVVELTMRPALQEAIAKGDTAREQLVARSWLASVAGLSIAGAILITVLSRALAAIFLAGAYQSASDLMPWISFGMAFYSIGLVYTRFCYSYDDTQAVFIITVGGTVAGIVVMLPLIHAFGLTGAAIAVPIYFSAQLLLSAALYYRAVSRHRQLRADRS